MKLRIEIDDLHKEIDQLRSRIEKLEELMVNTDRRLRASQDGYYAPQLSKLDIEFK